MSVGAGDNKTLRHEGEPVSLERIKVAHSKIEESWLAQNVPGHPIYKQGHDETCYFCALIFAVEAAEARVEAVEAENAELKAGGDRPEAVAVAQELPMRPLHERITLLADWLESPPKRRGRAKHVAAFEIRDLREAAAALASSVKQGQEGLGGQRSALSRSAGDSE